MKTLPVTCDTSVIVPALHPALPQHEACRGHLRSVDALAAHTVLESYRVLTGAKSLPAVTATAVAAALEAINVPHLQLPPDEYLRIVKIMAAAGRPGGAIYDAQIAATAKHHGLKLLSRDRRAAAIYDLVGVDYELI